MPIFFQHPINETTRLGIWKIGETEEFFKANVPLHREVTHPHKRLQHLAGRFLLQYLFPDFPYELIEIADTRKPFLPGEQYHFSISHCGDYAAAIVSKDKRVGIDIEIPVEKIMRIRDKFLSAEEKNDWSVVSGQWFPDSYRGANGEYHPASGLRISDSPLPTHNFRLPTLLWSVKEAVFKWYGEGGVDFREHMHLQLPASGSKNITCLFTKGGSRALPVEYILFEQIVVAWVVH